jgi:pimeloyl-ACP methyl ester carboxylesterase
MTSGILGLRSRMGSRLALNLVSDILPNAGHILNWDQPELVNERLLSFFLSQT